MLDSTGLLTHGFQKSDYGLNVQIRFRNPNLLQQEVHRRSHVLRYKSQTNRLVGHLVNTYFFLRHFKGNGKRKISYIYLTIRGKTCQFYYHLKSNPCFLSFSYLTIVLACPQRSRLRGGRATPLQRRTGRFLSWLVGNKKELP